MVELIGRVGLQIKSDLTDVALNYAQRLTLNRATRCSLITSDLSFAYKAPGISSQCNERYVSLGCTVVRDVAFVKDGIVGRDGNLNMADIRIGNR